MRLGYQDAVLNLQGPIATQGAAEFPAALADLRGQLGITGGSLALVGGSMGSAVAALALTETAPAVGEAVAAAVLISPMAQLRDAVDATGRRFGVTYPWGPVSLEVAARLDFVARAEGFLQPAQRLQQALAVRYADPSRVDVAVIPGMGHVLAEEPGMEPAPQTPVAGAVDRHAAVWLQQHLLPASVAMTR